MPTVPAGATLEAWAVWVALGFAGVVAMLAFRYDAAKNAQISYMSAMLDRMTAENRELTRAVATLTEILERRR